MTPRRSDVDRSGRTAHASRRAVLAGAGAGLAALAGCASVDLGGDEREYDPAVLAAVAEQDVPVPPDPFPVEVTAAMVDRHRDRARELLSAVPERPDVPNGVVAHRLRTDRERVVDDLEDGSRDAATALERLASARRVRADAGEVVGTYRAATRTIDHETVVERRAALRADRLSFEGDWDYRGDAPAPALVVHAELESLRERARRNAAAWPPFPADPAADVFRVGDLVRDLESGRAALSDVDRLRTRYLEAAGDPRSHRTAIAAAAHRLDARVRWDQRPVHEYLDTRAEDLPSRRSPEGAPARYLYREARRRALGAVRNAGRRRRAGDHATATLRGARTLARLRAFEAVVDAVERGDDGSATGDERLATARRAAVAALEAAWGTSPAPVSAEVAEPARDALEYGHRELEGSGGYRGEADRALAMFDYAGRYAEAVPAAVGTVVEALDVGR